MGVLYQPIVFVHVDKSILNNLEPSKAIFDELYTKVIYLEATKAIDEIASDIHTLLKNKVDTLSDNLVAATVHMQNHNLEGLVFDYERDANSLYNYLSKQIKKVDDLTKEEFDSVISNLIVEFKHRRDKNLKENETIKDYNALICFFVNEFDYS